MTQTFYKYQGTGNDFVFIDNRSLKFNKKDTKVIAHLCDRRFGIGADGLILLENDSTSDFRMVYYNADGNESSMCGNGGRCIVAFAKFLKIIDNKTTFVAIDGLHHATIEDDLVKLKMQNVEAIEVFENYTFLNTGSPHHVQLSHDLERLDVKTKGAKIRYGKPYNKVGSNVNFVQKVNDHTFRMRTYERGVEDETLSCGTGATAVALAMYKTQQTKSKTVLLKVEGGELLVSFEADENQFKNIWLIGSAKQVFKGEISW
ncbi:diaminopimelate epimerase [Lacinutrix salivirga]